MSFQFINKPKGSLIGSGYYRFRHYGAEPLCFTANTAGSTVAMSVNGTPTLSQNFSYSTDGASWNTFTPGTTTITLVTAGDKVYFKGNNPNGVSESDSSYYQFVMSGSIAGSGNIMSLIDNGACAAATIPNNYCFYSLFLNCTGLTSAPLLPAISLMVSCYEDMFRGCSALVSSANLPATTLADNCYYNMYRNTAITEAPALLANTLAAYCYKGMFQGCSNLVTPPTLASQSLATDCYFQMFKDCTSLTTPPALPATVLPSNDNNGCYSQMFCGCTALTSVPNLPATSISLSSGGAPYYSMFYGCTSLYISDSVVSGIAEQPWTIPNSGTFSTSMVVAEMFTNCLGVRSSNNLTVTSGTSVTYYTQNTPV